jgi:hypothetical protein
MRTMREMPAPIDAFIICVVARKPSEHNALPH